MPTGFARKRIALFLRLLYEISDDNHHFSAKDRERK